MTDHDIALAVLIACLAGIAIALSAMAILSKRAVQHWWTRWQIAREVDAQRAHLAQLAQRRQRVAPSRAVWLDQD